MIQLTANCSIQKELDCVIEESFFCDHSKTRLLVQASGNIQQTKSQQT